MSVDKHIVGDVVLRKLTVKETYNLSELTQRGDAVPRLTNCVKHLRQVDGYCCLVSKRDGRVVLWSRRGNGFTARFPAIARACETPLATAFDSLIVGYYEGAKLKFVGQGQERLRSTHVLRDPPALPGAED